MSTRASTRRTSLVWVENYIRPKWGKVQIARIKPVEVRSWMKSLKLSGKSKGHIHSLMRSLFQSAMLWEWIPVAVNPMSLFRTEGSSKTQKRKIILTVEQFNAILAMIPREPFRTMVLTAMCIGPRRSEFTALKWLDFNWEKKTLYIRRGIVAPPVLIDISNVAELRAIRADARALEIGAAVKLAELAAHDEVVRHYPVVAQAAGFIAGPTHRNMGTVGGNLCLDTRCLFYNQSEWWRAANHHCLKTTGDICHVAPKSRGVCFATFSGDLAPALLTLGAEVDLAGPAGRRTIALEHLYIGYARQDRPITESEGDGKYYLSLRPGEFVTAVRARNTPGLRSAYDKIRIRRSIEYPVCSMVAAIKTSGTEKSPPVLCNPIKCASIVSINWRLASDSTQSRQVSPKFARYHCAV